MREMREGDSNAETNGPTHSIVNPAKLKPWLADNICMSCHQTGDAMVLRPGKDYRDFKPGTPLDDTLAIFMVPPRRDSPQTDLLEHYFSMTLSKCYRSSGGRLSCITCHDPHVEPAKQDAPATTAQKCLALPQWKKVVRYPLATRQRKTPPDDCAGCHMPKREVQTIAHAVLDKSSHRRASRRTLPGCRISLGFATNPRSCSSERNPEQAGDVVSPTVLLQAYGQLMMANPEYRARYFAFAKQLESSDPNNVDVLEALAALALEQGRSYGDPIS